MMEELWQKYFDEKYIEVFNEANKFIIDNSVADFLHISGLSIMALGNIQEGLGRIKASLALCPTMNKWSANASIMSLRMGENNESLVFAKEGLRHNPNDPVLHFSAGNAYMALFENEKSRDCFLKALTIDPNFHDARLNLGNTIHRLGDLNGALKCFETILTADPTHEAANINRAGILFELGRDEEASSILTKMSESRPEVAFMLAMLRLMEGQYEEGWKLYRKRWECPMAIEDRKLIKKPFPDNLKDLQGKHVLFFHEQGFGDGLQFIRYLPMLVKNARKVTVLVPKQLRRLVQRIDPFVTVVETREQASTYDFELPFMDAPFMFNTTLENIPNKPYFSVPKEVQEIRKLPVSNKKIRVGLCWSGQSRPNPDLASVDRRRSMSLGLFKPLLKSSPGNIEFVSLQLGEASKQVGHIHTSDGEFSGENRMNFPHIIQPLKDSFDFLDTAAIIQQLDLVITVDTSVAHLAGGLGVPVWVFSRFDGCWRWLRGRTESPWYPSLRLFNQKIQGSWDEPMVEMIEALKDFTNAH